MEGRKKGEGRESQTDSSSSLWGGGVDGWMVAWFVGHLSLAPCFWPDLVWWQRQNALRLKGKCGENCNCGV